MILKIYANGQTNYMGKRTKLKESGQRYAIYLINRNTQIKGKLQAHYDACTVKQLWQW